MTITTKDIPSMKKVLDYVKESPDLQPMEIATRIFDHEKIPATIVLETLHVYYRARKSFANIERDVRDRRVKHELWIKIEEIRKAHTTWRERAKKKATPTKEQRVIAQKERAHAKWKAELELALGDPEKNWAKVDAITGLTSDLMKAASLAGGGKERAIWFRQQIAQNSEWRKKIDSMVHKISETRQAIRELRQRQISDRMSVTERAALIIDEERRRLAHERKTPLRRRDHRPGNSH